MNKVTQIQTNPKFRQRKKIPNKLKHQAATITIKYITKLISYQDKITRSQA